MRMEIIELILIHHVNNESIAYRNRLVSDLIFV